MGLLVMKDLLRGCRQIGFPVLRRSPISHPVGGFVPEKLSYVRIPIPSLCDHKSTLQYQQLAGEFSFEVVPFCCAKPAGDLVDQGEFPSPDRSMCASCWSWRLPRPGWANLMAHA